MSELMISPRARPQLDVPDLKMDTVLTPIPVVAAYLQKRLTQRLTAYILDISDGRDIGRYAREERAPHGTTQNKLRSIYELLNGVLKDEDDQIIQLWFQGQNPEVKNEAPAKALRNNFFESFPSVIIAAEKLVELSRR